MTINYSNESAVGMNHDPNTNRKPFAEIVQMQNTRNMSSIPENNIYESTLTEIY